MLLADVKEFQSIEGEGKSLAPPEDQEQGYALPENVRNIISKVVTADFFLIIAFFVWFLAGIFCSYILKDDTVQIAFNRKYRSLCWDGLWRGLDGLFACNFLISFCITTCTF